MWDNVWKISDIIHEDSRECFTRNMQKKNHESASFILQNHGEINNHLYSSLSGFVLLRCLNFLISRLF